MTILATDIITPNFLTQCGQLSDAAREAAPMMNFSQWISEFRTFTISLPRRSLKTTALVQNLTADTYMIVRNQVIKQCIYNQFFEMSVPRNPKICTLPDFQYSLLRTSTTVEPISKLFLDEPDPYIEARDALMEVLIFLNYRRLLTDDFFILRVGTPVY